jgi:Sec-independent protein translocase protein TatA
MEFLGVGPLELLFIFLIALIVLGPNDIVKTSRTVGRFLRKVVTSPTWSAIQQTSREIRYLPNKLIREAGLEEQAKSLNEISSSMKELGNFQANLNLNESLKANQGGQSDFSAWTTPPDAAPMAPPVVSEPEKAPSESAVAEGEQPDQETNPS